MSDDISHPKHYNVGKFEVIDVIEDWKLGFSLGNAIKYIARAGHKNSDKAVEDLKKSIWYIEREIKVRQEKDQHLPNKNLRLQEDTNSNTGDVE